MRGTIFASPVQSVKSAVASNMSATFFIILQDLVYITQYFTTSLICSKISKVKEEYTVYGL